MSVQEVVQGDGQWSLTLKEGTPGEILDRLQDWFCQLKIFSSHVQPSEVPNLAPFFTGVLLDNPSPYEISGVGPNWYLGSADATGDQVGPIFETAIGSGLSTLTHWVHAAADQAGLGYGTIGATATTWTGSLQYVTPRVLIDPWMRAGFAQALEYRVGPSLNLSVGLASEIYRNPGSGTISAVIVKEDPSNTGVDPVGVYAPQLNLDLSAEDLLRRVVLKRSGGTNGSSVGVWNYKNPAGSTLQRVMYTVNEQVSSSDASGYLSRILDQRKVLKKAITVSVGGDPPHGFICGDWVWVFDPERGLWSTSNDLQHGGRTIYPVAVRVMEMTWPVTEGLGVFLVNTHQGGGVTDLTNWVEWEDGDTTLTVGAYPRRLSYLARPAVS